MLSFDTSLRFIFSVWALQEGWDNPNIFQICKLASTNSDTSKRQQVGRGLRIAVDQNGSRLTEKHKSIQKHEQKFYEINTLDVVVSGQEKEFIHSIQKEIQEASFSVVGDFIDSQLLKEKGLNNREASKLLNILEDNHIIEFKEEQNQYKITSSVLDFLSSHKNNTKLQQLEKSSLKKILTLFTNNTKAVFDRNQASKKNNTRSKQFKKFRDLWENINRKAKIVYKNIKEEELIENISKHFNQEKIPAIKVKITKDIYNTQKNQVEQIREEYIGDIDFFKRINLTEFIIKFAKEERLTLTFVAKLFQKLNRQHFKNNPELAKTKLIQLIKDEIHKTMLRKISYNFSSTIVYPNALQGSNKNLKEKIDAYELGKFECKEEAMPHYLYDRVLYDSEIEKNSILKDPIKINDDSITVFAKLPKINIPSPYKIYNPDFAYLLERKNSKNLFLIVETKGYDKATDISQDEQLKIDYAKRFFADLKEALPEVDIQYKTRINTQDLSQLLEEIQNDR